MHFLSEQWKSPCLLVLVGDRGVKSLIFAKRYHIVSLFSKTFGNIVVLKTYVVYRSKLFTSNLFEIRIFSLNNIYIAVCVCVLGLCLWISVGVSVVYVRVYVCLCVSVCVCV